MGKTAILEQGAKYDQIGLSPSQAGADTTKKMTIADVARITGVPQFLFGGFRPCDV
jgi:Phage-related protein